MEEKEVLIHQTIENKIYLIRGQKVMLDSDLAELYSITTKVFNQAVKRNLERFPEDFMFQLTDNVSKILRSQIATSKNCHTILFTRGYKRNRIQRVTIR